MEELKLGLWEAMKSRRPYFRCSLTQLSNPTIPSRSIQFLASRMAFKGTQVDYTPNTRV